MASVLPMLWVTKWANWKCDNRNNPLVFGQLFPLKELLQRILLKHICCPCWQYLTLLLNKCLYLFNNLVCVYICMTVSLLTAYFNSLWVRSFSDKCVNFISPMGLQIHLWDSVLIMTVCTSVTVLDVFPMLPKPRNCSKTGRVGIE